MQSGMYNKKKKKIVDPNAPPRPTLLGHEKELKIIKNQYNDVVQSSNNNSTMIALLKRKISRLESRLDMAIEYLRRK